MGKPQPLGLCLQNPGEWRNKNERERVAIEKEGIKWEEGGM